MGLVRGTESEKKEWRQLQACSGSRRAFDPALSWKTLSQRHGMERKREATRPVRFFQGKFHFPTGRFRLFRRVPAGHAVSAMIGNWASREEGLTGSLVRM